MRQASESRTSSGQSSGENRKFDHGGTTMREEITKSQLTLLVWKYQKFFEPKGDYNEGKFIEWRPPIKLDTKLS